MSNYYMNGEGFDNTSNAEIKYNKGKKNFKIAILITIIVFIIALAVILLLLNKKKEKIVEPMIELIPITQHVVVESPEELYQDRKQVLDYHAKIRQQRELLFGYEKNNFNTSKKFFNNSNLEIYADGTYYEYELYRFNGEYSEKSIIGKIDLTQFNMYFEEIKELLSTKSSFEMDDHALYDNANVAVRFGENDYRLLRLNDPKDYEVAEKFLEVIENSEKEVIQDYLIEQYE